jgi:hypothetical protein
MYAQRWWGPVSRIAIRPTLLLSSCISLLFLAAAFTPSILLPRIHRRVRHYLRSYITLLNNLLRV